MRQLAANLDQLDLAFEHIAKGDANNARFALMLVDNIVEITLHRFAEHRDAKRKAQAQWRHESPVEDSALAEAIGRNFEPKVKFARSTGYVRDEVAKSILTLHSYRNELYHIGLRHEPVLPACAAFYFGIACDLLVDFCPLGLGFSPRMSIPERAAKFFRDTVHFRNAREDYKTACAKLKSDAALTSPKLPASLTAHIDAIIDESDRLLDYLAIGQNRSRDEIIIDCQVWPLAFTEEGKRFARENGCHANTVDEYIDWLGKNFRWKLKGDPIAKWRLRAKSVGEAPCSHKALEKYQCFMSQTVSMRVLIERSAEQYDAHVEEQIEAMRDARA